MIFPRFRDFVPLTSTDISRSKCSSATDGHFGLYLKSHPEHDSLLRITLEGQIQGKKVYGRPRMFLDWLLKMEDGNISYKELKMFAQDRSRWSQ